MRRPPNTFPLFGSKCSLLANNKDFWLFRGDNLWPSFLLRTIRWQIKWLTLKLFHREPINNFAYNYKSWSCPEKTQSLARFQVFNVSRFVWTLLDCPRIFSNISTLSRLCFFFFKWLMLKLFYVDKHWSCVLKFEETSMNGSWSSVLSSPAARK